MFISVDTSKLDIPEAKLAVVNLTEFNKAKTFILVTVTELAQEKLCGLTKT